MQHRDDRAQHFVHYLEGLVKPEARDGRGVLAALRRGLGKRPGEAPEMYPYLVPWTSGLTGWGEETYYLVASLFALHRMAWTGGEGSSNFGASMARLHAAEGGESTERRFVALLGSHRDDLPDHLRHAVSLCAANEVRIDWTRLLRDLRNWDADTQWVQLTWARAFWQRADEPAETA